MRVGSVSSADVWAEGGRLTGGYHLSEDQVAVARLGRLASSSARLGDLVEERGLFRGPIFKRIYAAGAAHGEPYVSASDLLEAHVRPASYLSPSLGRLLEELRVREGTILITCSGMNLGSAIWTRPDTAGLVATHDLIRIYPDEKEAPAGYVFAYLAGRYGHAWIRKQIYGGNIKHIEPSHLEPMPVPRFSRKMEAGVSELVERASLLMADFNGKVVEATRQFFESVGLDDMTGEDWHAQGRDLGFQIMFPGVDTLRALNNNPRLRWLEDRLRDSKWKPLREVLRPGTLKRGTRFSRVDASDEHSVRLVGQKHMFWMKPLGRRVARWAVPDDATIAPGTTLVAAQGTLGETELYCRAEFIWGSATENAYSEHLLRFVADESTILSGCLFAFLRSETAFRILRSISSGSKQQEQHRDLRERIPIPIPGMDDQRRIHNLITAAYDARHQSTSLQDEAIRLVETAIEEAS